MIGNSMNFHVSSNKRSSSISPSKIPLDVDNPPFYLPLKSFNGRYKLVSNLGNGSFGSVGLAKSCQNLLDPNKFKTYRNTLLERDGFYKHENYFNKKTGLVAIKTMNKKLNELNDYTKVKEIRFILAMPFHQNLVQVYELFIDNLNFKLHIVMECMDQNLYQLMKARKNNYFSQTTLKSILSQILCGIRHIHRNQYFHRDIKPENILVTPSNRFYDQSFINSKEFKYHDSFIVKIADYGLARHVDNKRPYTSYVSTRWYRAPEILFRKNWYSRPVDIWAFGSVAAEVATFRPLFPGANECEQTYKVLDVLGTPLSRNNISSYFPVYGYWDEVQSLSNKIGIKLPLKKCVDISLYIPNPELKDLCDVIKACLAWDPYTRADAETICEMPYFKGTCVDDSPASRVVPIPVSTNVKVFKNYNNNYNNYNFNNNVKSGILEGIPNLTKLNEPSNKKLSMDFFGATFSQNKENNYKDHDHDFYNEEDQSQDQFNDAIGQNKDLIHIEKEGDTNLESFQYCENIDQDEGNSQNISPDATETNYSFLNDDFVGSSSSPKNNSKVDLDEYAKNLLHSNEAIAPAPNLTQDSIVTNDENINGYQGFSYEQGHQYHNKPVKQLSDVYNSLGNNQESSPNIDPNYIYYQPQHGGNPAYQFQNFNNMTNDVNNFAEWEAKRFGNMPKIVDDPNLNLDTILSDHLNNNSNGSFKYQDPVNDSLLGIYTNDHSYQKTDENNANQTDYSIGSNNQFTGELLSKFNLRRIPQVENSSQCQKELCDHSFNDNLSMN